MIYSTRNILSNYITIIVFILLCTSILSAQAAVIPDARNEASRLFYDANGNLTGVHDPLSRTGTHQYDALGRRIKSTPILLGQDPSGSVLTVPTAQGTPITGGNDNQYGSASYTYDSFNLLTSVTDPRGLVTRYDYDGFGNLLTQYLPDSKTTTNTYDSAGRVTDSVDANGNRTHIEYTGDFTNRPATITYRYATPNASVVTLNYYGINDAPIGSKSKLKEIIDPSHSQNTSYGYDSMGRISRVKTTTASTNGGVFTLITDYGYDSKTGQLLSITYPHLDSAAANRRTVSLEHNGPDRSQVSRVTTTYNGVTLPIVTGPGGKPITYRPFGGVTGMVLAYGLDASRDYDADGRLLSYKLKTTAGGTTSDTRTLGIDAASRILAYAHTANTAADQSFAYDELDRLQRANAASSALGYDYDKNGNRIRKQVGTVQYQPVIEGSDAHGSNRLRSTPDAPARTYLYDNGKADANGNPAGNGNITSDGFFDYQYDARNRLVAVLQHADTTITSINSKTVNTAATPVAQYQYNFQGKRFFKSATLNGVTTASYFHYDLGGKLIAETDATGKTTREYLYFGNLPVAFVSYSGTTPTLYAIQADHINTPRVMTDANRNVVWQWLDTDPFGVKQPTGTLSMNLRFPGQYFDAETGLYHNGFRDYNPELGRYMQSDPIGLAGGSWSTYAYVNGNPVSYTDPSGLLGFETNFGYGPGVWAGGGVTAASGSNPDGSPWGLMRFGIGNANPGVKSGDGKTSPGYKPDCKCSVTLGLGGSVSLTAFRLLSGSVGYSSGVRYCDGDVDLYGKFGGADDVRASKGSNGGLSWNSGVDVSFSGSDSVPYLQPMTDAMRTYDHFMNTPLFPPYSQQTRDAAAVFDNWATMPLW